MNLTKARAEKAQRDLEKQAIKNRELLNRMISYKESAKGGDLSAIIPVIKGLKDSQQGLSEARKALEKAQERKGWI